MAQNTPQTGERACLHFCDQVQATVARLNSIHLSSLVLVLPN